MINALDIWLPAWRRREERHEHILGVRHVMVAVCDHFDPFTGVGQSEALSRLEMWRRQWPQIAGEFRDADGVGPRHTFFYPIERFDADAVAGLAELKDSAQAETEMLLHHEDDTAENLRATLAQAKERLASHGLLARDAAGATRFGFVHGHGALDHSHPCGRHCGVRNELGVLAQSGCYADFTLPTAPDRTQTSTINQLYYARGTDAPKSHDRGRSVRSERHPYQPSADELLIVQGPLALDSRRKKFGILPTVENGELTAANPPTIDRMRLWLDCRISVGSRPNWLFVKLHTRGAHPDTARMLLGEPLRAFYRDLAAWSARDDAVRFHYVSTREMVNILHAAESGHSGDPGQFRDYRYRSASSAVATTSTEEAAPAQ